MTSLACVCINCKSAHAQVFRRPDGQLRCAVCEFKREHPHYIVRPRSLVHVGSEANPSAQPECDDCVGTYQVQLRSDGASRCNVCQRLREDPNFAQECFDKGLAVPESIIRYWDLDFDDDVDDDLDDDDELNGEYDHGEYDGDELLEAEDDWPNDEPYEEESALVPVQPQYPVAQGPAVIFPPLPEIDIPATLGDPELVMADIWQIVQEATSPLVERRQTLLEWFRNEDPTLVQLAEKAATTRNAVEVINLRTDLYYALCDLIQASADAQLQFLRAQAALLEEQNYIFDLQEQIAERRALLPERIQTQITREQVLQQQLWQQAYPPPPPPLPPPPVDERQHVIREHRHNRLARSDAGRLVIQDFLAEIQDVCNSRIGNHRKALEIREIMAAYDMGEDTLPRDARFILEVASRRQE